MAQGITGLGEDEEEGEAPFKPQWQGGIPWQYMQGPYGPQMFPIPSGYQPDPYAQLMQRFGQFAGQLGNVPGLGALGTGLQGMLGSIGGTFANAYPDYFGLNPQYNYGQGGGGGGALRYDPFAQEMDAAKFQELMRQFQMTQGLERSKFLQSMLSTPSNIYSSFFQARGEIPPYNAQLANILNIPGQGSPWFGALPPMGPTPGMPTVPTPQPPQAIPYAAGGTHIPAEPVVAIGLHSGQPLFTFNEQAPAKTEKVKITPQKKGKALEGQYIPPGVPGFQGGGNVYTTGVPGVTRGATPTPSPTGFPGYPDPLADVWGRGMAQFPYLRELGLGQGLDYPQFGKALHGMPLPSPQTYSRMTPSEGRDFMNVISGVFGQDPADVLWASLLPFRGLRGAMPAMQRMG